MKPIHYAALILLGAVWGASFLFIGVAAPDFGPITLMFLRVFVGGLILFIIAYLTHRHQNIKDTIRLRQNWRKYLIVGLLNCALPFTLQPPSTLANISAAFHPSLPQPCSC